MSYVIEFNLNFKLKLNCLAADGLPIWYGFFQIFKAKCKRWQLKSSYSFRSQKSCNLLLNIWNVKRLMLLFAALDVDLDFFLFEQLIKRSLTSIQSPFIIGQTIQSLYFMLFTIECFYRSFVEKWTWSCTNWPLL